MTVKAYAASYQQFSTDLLHRTACSLEPDNGGGCFLLLTDGAFAQEALVAMLRACRYVPAGDMAVALHAAFAAGADAAASAETSERADRKPDDFLEGWWNPLAAVGAYLGGSSIMTASLGDGRVVVVRRGGIAHSTHPHTVADENPELAPESAAAFSNVSTVRLEPKCLANLRSEEWRVESEDTIILMPGRLSGCLSNEDIASLVAESRFEEVATSLFRKAFGQALPQPDTSVVVAKVSFP